MRVSSDFRRIARNALRNKWILAVIIGLIVSLLGGAGVDVPEIKLVIENNHPDLGVYYGDNTIFSTSHGFLPKGLGFIAGAVAIFSVIIAIIRMIIGSIIGIGYARFNMELVNDGNPRFENLLAYLSGWKTAICTALLKALKVFLWSLLLVIPGIIAGYKYALTDYILAETPHIKASEAIDISTTLMQGNKWRLFCLRFSFIGWDILATLTFGLGNYLLTPYKRAAEAAFYMDIVKSSYSPFDN